MKWINIEEGLPDEDCLCMVVTVSRYSQGEYRNYASLEFRCYEKFNVKSGKIRNFPFSVQNARVIAWCKIPRVPSDVLFPFESVSTHIGHSMNYIENNSEEKS